MKFADFRLKCSQDNWIEFLFEKIIAQKLTTCSKLINKTSSLLNLWPKMLRFTLFSWVKLSFVESYCCKRFDKFVVCAAYQLDLGIKINSQTCLGHFVLLKHCQTHTEAKLAKALKDYTQRNLMKSFVKSS